MRIRSLSLAEGGPISRRVATKRPLSSGLAAISCCLAEQPTLGLPDGHGRACKADPTMDERATRDERLDDLAQTLADMLGVNKTEAMRLALQNEIERLRSTPTIDDQIATLRETVKNYGRKSTRMVHPSKKR